MQWNLLTHKHGEPRKFEPLSIVGEDGHSGLMYLKTGGQVYELVTMQFDGEDEVVLLQEQLGDTEAEWENGISFFHWMRMPTHKHSLGDINPESALGLRLRFLWTIAGKQKADYYRDVYYREKEARKTAAIKQEKGNDNKLKVEFTAKQLDRLKAVVDAFPGRVESLKVTNIDDGDDDTVIITFNYNEETNNE